MAFFGINWELSTCSTLLVDGEQYDRVREHNDDEGQEVNHHHAEDNVSILPDGRGERAEGYALRVPRKIRVLGHMENVGLKKKDHVIFTAWMGFLSLLPARKVEIEPYIGTQILKGFMM